MDQNSQINVIGHKSGPDFHMPKMPGKLPKAWIAVLTVVLALVTVVSAVLLYRNREEPVVPTPTGASTTTNVADDFNAATLNTALWNTEMNGGTTIGPVNGKLAIAIPAQTAETMSRVTSKSWYTGDFSFEADLVSTETAAGGVGQTGIAVVGSTQSEARIVRIVSAGITTISGNFAPGTTPTTATIPDNTAPVRAKIVRVGSIMQLFYDTGTGYQLLATNQDAYIGDVIVNLYSRTLAPQFLAVTSTFDNFSGQANLGDTPVPTPGTTAACTIAFSVLDVAPTSTPGSTPTPTVTPTGTLTPTATPTATPTPTTPQTNACGGTCTTNSNCNSGLVCSGGACRNPLCSTDGDCTCGTSPTPTPTPPASCNNTCTSNVDCMSGLTCSGGRCRNPLCTTQTSCGCVSSTPTPTTPLAQAPSPTPVILQQAGSVDATWMLGIGGAILLGLGSLLLFAL